MKIIACKWSHSVYRLMHFGRHPNKKIHFRHLRMREEVKINCGFKGLKEGGGGGGGTCHVSGRTEELAEMITFHNMFPSSSPFA